MKFPNGHYNNDQLSVLSAALILVCKELDISGTDDVGRERIAVQLLALAQSEPCDTESLSAKAVEQFRDQLRALPSIASFEMLDGAE
ncbi:hypothetical protein [Hyphomicrobium sp. 2TAF46]|uniref:hypothetical protein n=1 Tax=Hyphomicrobium sp. 2TAF46 TaxID=3233019 RepID=UPI003F92E6C0